MELEVRAFEHGRARQGARKIEPGIRHLQMRLERIASARQCGVGREQAALQAERLAVRGALARKRDRAVHLALRARDVAHIHAQFQGERGIGVIEVGVGDAEPLDLRDGRGPGGLRAESPGVLARAVPFEVSASAVEQQIAQPPVAEDQRQRVQFEFERLAAEQLRPGRPRRVADAQPVRAEVDARIEIKLEIARHMHRALRVTRGVALEIWFEEPALGDPQDRIGQHQQPEQRDRQREQTVQAGMDRILARPGMGCGRHRRLYGQAGGGVPHALHGGA